MKSSLVLIIFLALLTSCGGSVRSDDIRSRIVDIISLNWDGVHGKGVILTSGIVLTSRHVVERCAHSESGILRVDGCYIAFRDGKKVTLESLEYPDSSLDIARAQYQSMGTIGLSEIFPKENRGLMLGESVRVYTATGIIEGKILALDPSYIGYDASLSGRLLSGSIVTDIILSPGESGMPLWTVSGELIGVVSAVDTVGKRSYIVE